MTSHPPVFYSEHEGSTLIVIPVGSISSLAGGVVQPQVDDLLESIADREVRNVVFDLEEVSYFGSVMLAAMHSVWKRVRAAQGKMVLCNVSDLGREILQIARFDLIWPICDSREEALSAVAG